MNDGRGPLFGDLEGLAPLAPRMATRSEAKAYAIGGEVAHGAIATFTVEPVHQYRPRRLVIAPECAPYYEVLAIQGRVLFLDARETPLAASAFPPLPQAFDPATIESFAQYILTFFRMRNGAELAPVFDGMQHRSREGMLHDLTLILQSGGTHWGAEAGFATTLAGFVRLFDKYEFETIDPGTPLMVQVRHRTMCPVHTDCVDGNINCQNMRFQAHWEGLQLQ